MQFLQLIALSLSTALVAGQRYNAGKSGITRGSVDNGVISQRYIVEFADPAGLRRRAPQGDHITAFFETLADSGVEATPQLNISSEVFEGVSFTTDNVTKIEDLRVLEEVLNVWPVRRIKKPEPIIHKVGEDATEQWSSHLNTGVLDLHKQGIQGEGATVAIIDTGIDYNHPSLGGGLGAGFKVEGGVDIVGDDYFGAEFLPDDDPMDYSGHGTHVAGIVAGSGDANYVSVAPKAKLRAYKVFGNSYSYTGDDALILAFVTAYEDGVDVINASIGGPSGWPEDAWAAVASRLVERGVFITISAGNSGATGIWYGSSGASGTEVLSVASIDTEKYLAFNSVVKGKTTREVPYLPTELKPFGLSGEVEIYVSSTDPLVPNDACYPLPDIDLSGKIVLIRRGSCSFQEKGDNAYARGAEYVWFYNQRDAPPLYPNIGYAVLQGYALITAEAGEAIVAEAAAGTKVTVSFSSGAPVTIPNAITGGKMSIFTSWGPDNEAHIKPEIGAPGGSIYSTYPLSLGGHAILSGTSMASPYVAGVAALYIAKAGGRAALGPAGIKELKAKIITSGTLVNYNDGKTTDWSQLAPIAQQGGGYISASKLFYSTTLSPGKLELNDTAHFKPGHSIKIKNSGKKNVLYTLSHEPAATVNSFEPGYSDVQIFPPTFVANASATVKFSVPGTVSVRPGATNSFKVTFTPPNIDSTLFPVYSGKIVVTGSNGEVLSIPYMGVVGNMKDIEIWDVNGGEPFIINDETGVDITEPAEFTMVENDRPAVVLFNHFGSAENRWDIVSADWNMRDWAYPPVEGKKRFIGSVVDAYDGVMFPWKYVPRADPLSEQYYYYYGWKGDLTNGTMIAPGTYKMLVSTLKPFGNPKKSADWQMKLSPKITVLPPPSK